MNHRNEPYRDDGWWSDRERNREARSERFGQRGGGGREAYGEGEQYGGGSWYGERNEQGDPSRDYGDEQRYLRRGARGSYGGGSYESTYRGALGYRDQGPGQQRFEQRGGSYDPYGGEQRRDYGGREYGGSSGLYGGREESGDYFGTGGRYYGSGDYGGYSGSESWRNQRGGQLYGQSYGQGYGYESGRGGRSGEQGFGETRFGESRGREGGGLLRRLFRRGPKGYSRSDERIQEDVNERLWQATEIDSSEVTVNVASGVVTLEGTVPERWMRHAIENEADRCSGVKDINNNIRVQREQESQSGMGAGTSGTSTSGTSTSGSTSGTTTSGTTSRTKLS